MAYVDNSTDKKSHGCEHTRGWYL